MNYPMFWYSWIWVNYPVILQKLSSDLVANSLAVKTERWSETLCTLPQIHPRVHPRCLRPEFLIFTSDFPTMREQELSRLCSREVPRLGVSWDVTWRNQENKHIKTPVSLDDSSQHLDILLEYQVMVLDTFISLRFRPCYLFFILLILEQMEYSDGAEMWTDVQKVLHHSKGAWLPVCREEDKEELFVWKQRSFSLNF